MHLKQSKIDKLSQGVDVYIGCSSHTVCAYCLLKEILKLRVDVNPLSPLFSSMSVRVLRKAYFVNATRLALSSVGLIRHFIMAIAFALARLPPGLTVVLITGS